ncbi:hypothetical protein BX616_006293 [Lobosporangium transversale]|nr:hypothetical protein BX616_006293 [Lobosporangium transversale]
MTTETTIVKSNSQISLRTATQRQQSQSSQIQTILTGQELQAEELMRSVRYYYERLQIEVQKSSELQERIYTKQKEAKELMLKGQKETQQWQQRIMDQQISMKKSFEEKSEKMIRMQEKALERLALIQNRIQAVLSQTYELHEYPIPHLFIVLPKPARRRDALMNPLSNQFRLFFLSEFFQKYGPYVLTMMEMIKFGFAVAGMVVPPLAHTGLVDGVEAIKGSLNVANESIGSLVDETINIINSQFANADGGMDLEDGQSRLDDVEALEGADLRQLESFLSVHDEGRVLGNLYRIVTTEGKVKWVCIDHYRENYRSATLQQIKDSLISHRAVFDEDDTKVYLTLRQKALSGDFYDNLLKMRGIQTLEIGIAWDATLNDLRQLAQIVSDANITNLKLYGNYFENSARDFFNNGRRYDPIVQLLQNRRIQSLEIADFKDFYAHVSSTPLGMAPQVRRLTLGSDFDATNKASRSLLTRILKSCPALARLTLWSKHFCPTIDFLMGHTSLIPTLDQLKVIQMDIDATFKLFRGKIHAASLRTLDPLAGVVAKEQEFLKRGLLTKVITRRGQEFTEDLWIEILRLNPNVSEIDIDCQDSRQALERIQLISAVRMKMVADIGDISLRTLKLSLGSNPILSLEYVFSDENNNAVNVESAGTFVVTKLNTTNFEKGHPADPLGSVLTRYGSMVERLVIDLPFKDSHASILDEVTKT